MHRNLKAAALSCAALTVFATGASAAVNFFPNNVAGFNAANAGNVLIGFENFENNTSVGSGVPVDDPLSQGVPNNFFPVGLTAPLSVQSNNLAGNPTVPSPTGSGALYLFDIGVAGGNVSDIVGANFFVDSLDMIFDPSDNVRGVGFNPVAIFSADPNTEIRVYNQANVLLGTGFVGSDPGATNFMGVVATGTDTIGRINVFSPGGQAEGGDNISIFSPIPEPTSMALLSLGGLTLLRRRRA